MYLLYDREVYLASINIDGLVLQLRSCFFCKKKILVFLLYYSLRPKINAILEFKICPTKIVNFDPPTTKRDKPSFRKILTKDN